MIYLYLFFILFAMIWMIEFLRKFNNMIELQDKLLEFQKRTAELQKDIIDHLRK